MTRGVTRWEAITGVAFWFVMSLSLVVIGIGAVVIWWWFELPLLEIAAAGGACIAAAGLLSLSGPVIS